MLPPEAMDTRGDKVKIFRPNDTPVMPQLVIQRDPETRIKGENRSTSPLKITFHRCHIRHWTPGPSHPIFLPLWEPAAYFFKHHIKFKCHLSRLHTSWPCCVKNGCRETAGSPQRDAVLTEGSLRLPREGSYTALSHSLRACMLRDQSEGHHHLGHTLSLFSFSLFTSLLPQLIEFLLNEKSTAHWM